MGIPGRLSWQMFYMDLAPQVGADQMQHSNLNWRYDIACDMTIQPAENNMQYFQLSQLHAG